MSDHEEHEMIALSGRRLTGELVAFLVCIEDETVIERLQICGVPTAGDGRPCRAPVRSGYAACPTHGLSKRKRRAS